jgi:type II secretory pathway pseudopilin PulG
MALIELLVAISILGICSTALLAGLATVIQTSATHRDSADANVVLVSAAESVKDAEFAPCASAAGAYLAFVVAHTAWPDGWTGDELEISVACDGSDPDEQAVLIEVAGHSGSTFELVVAKAQSAR